MSKKNRKNKKKKKGKESDGHGNSTGGGNKNNNNNHNNNISSPTLDDETVVETTTIVLTQSELEFIDNKCKLKGYPRSTYFVVGYRAMKAKQDDLAIASFKRGADNVGCVPSMVFYAYLQHKRGNFYLLLPYAVEGAIRGHTPSMNYLVDIYQAAKPVKSVALVILWTKMKIELGDTTYTEEERKEYKTSNICLICGKKESVDNNDVTIVKCGICKFYSYCGKKCQTFHWKEGKHNCECRQVVLLRKYCKPSYVKEIREAIIDGQDPKEIHTLQRLRKKLGLNRPKEEYEELLLSLANDDTNDTTKSPNRYEYLVGRKDGTVNIGSTPNVI